MRISDLSSDVCSSDLWGVDVIVDDQDLPDDVLRGRYDLIIGSDLLYERDAPQSLAQFIDRHAVDDAEVWMVDPNRGHRPAFNRHMASHGFVLQRGLRLPIGRAQRLNSSH